ncbi:hypothetical protein JOQ06_008787, partial [Pogonophryne albipinna]
MSYTGNYTYQYVSVPRIKKALLWLQAYNPYYTDILFNTEWLNRYEQDVNEQPTDEDAQPDAACVEEETSHDRQTHGMFMDTCLQPVDLGQEILDHYDTTLNIAPAEADMRWENVLLSMMHQEGRCDNVADLDWSDKCGLLRRNPVTAARMFDKRWRTFLKYVIQSPSQPIGKVVDFFYRVEFQQRGDDSLQEQESTNNRMTKDAASKIMSK